MQKWVDHSDMSNALVKLEKSNICETVISHLDIPNSGQIHNLLVITQKYTAAVFAEK